MKNLLFAIASCFFIMHTAHAQQEIPLYQNKVPNNKPGIKNNEKTETGDDGITRISQVSIPTLTIYKPRHPDPRGISVIICPGGGYAIVAINKEGHKVAEELNKRGITAFVLKYRLPSITTNINPSTTPLMDAQRAIQLVREDAKKYGINAERIGIMGFSAGGHLAATASTHFDTSLIENAQHINLRPDYTVLAYPVITMKDALTHKGSKNNLLTIADDSSGVAGENNKTKWFSAEENVTVNTPPAFVFHAMDDTGVPVKNSLLYFEELIDKNVKNNQLIIYPSGGHGFGLHLPNKTENWMDRMINWLNTLFP